MKWISSVAYLAVIILAMSSVQPRSLSLINNRLTFNMWKYFQKEDDNVVLSPFSLLSTLSMLLEASAGVTEVEIDDFLNLSQLGLSKQEIGLLFRQVFQRLGSINPANQLNTLNGMVISHDFNLLNDYKSHLDFFYGGAVAKQEDFTTNPNILKSKMDNWICHATKGAIKYFINETIEPTTKLFVYTINYMKGFWKYEFYDTTEKPFYNDGSNKVKFTFGLIKEQFLYFDCPLYRAISIPFAGDELAMLIILPRVTDTLRKITETLSPNLFSRLLSDMKLTLIDLQFPIHKMDYTADVITFLHCSGIHSLFSPKPELTGLSNVKKGIQVNYLLHRTLLEFYPYGSPHCKPQTEITTTVLYIVVDQPFLYFIYECISDMILFSGVVHRFDIYENTFPTTPSS